ncbi:MAG: inositol monophosphatase [Armatimonadetes bacterium]|nr:inositol monophosphatase [Armatimonadota bacterium]
MLEFIKKIALEAGEIIRHAYYKPETHIEYKGDIDILTETDLQCEEHIIKRILDRFPNDTILTEESKQTKGTTNRKWIIDPLDGTTNFSHRFPFCAVSIGLEINGEIRYGVVFNPIINELFYAEKNEGSFLNDKKISVSGNSEIKNCLIGTGFPYDRWQRGDYYIMQYLAFMKRCQGVRRAGAAAIDLCYVACGRLDGFFENKLRPWDMAAGSIIITEAGGKISQFDGEDWHYSNDTILVSNGKIHEKMIEILRGA